MKELKVVSGTAYWASVIVPNTRYDPDGVWTIDVGNLDDLNKKKVQEEGLTIKNKGDEKGDFGRRHADQRSENRAHAGLRRIGASKQKYADRTERRLTIKRPQGHRPYDLRSRSLPDGQQNRRERDRDEDRSADEQHRGLRVAKRQESLRADDPERLRDHVGGQDLAARLIGRCVVEPAFRRDVDARHAEPDQDAQQRPRPRLDEQWKRNQRGRHEAAERRKDTHMADAADQRRCQPRAGEEADEIARCDDGQLGRGEAFDATPQTNEGEMHAVAQHDQDDADQKRPDAGQDFEHRPPSFSTP